MITANYIFEASWEVCNKVGGIYTVLSTRAATMVRELGDRHRVVFVGPLLSELPPVHFIPTPQPWSEALAQKVGLPICVGEWNVPGQPLCVLVDYSPLREEKGALYFEMWERYGIDSSVGYGDYDDSCLFSIAAARVMGALHALVAQGDTCSVAVFNEWTTGMGLLYTRQHYPALRTIFITHATTVGRSIAGNGKPLYDYIEWYHGDGMARELHVVGKHTLERMAAQHAHGFGTVSEVTNVECRQLLGKAADVVVPNGFEPDFVPSAAHRIELRARGRQRLIQITSALYGEQIENPMIIATSGRCEYRNKGIDAFIEMLAYRAQGVKGRPLIALILVPSWMDCPRPELQAGLSMGGGYSLATRDSFLTHLLHEPYHNPIYAHLKRCERLWGRGVYPLYIPAYLDGSDGIVGVDYYDLLPALDLTLFPSYYEPWGYTPLESIAFGVPTVTTDKSGFGMWSPSRSIDQGVAVLHRNDRNVDALAREMSDVVTYVAQSPAAPAMSEAATALSHQAYWQEFYPHYLRLIAHALRPIPSSEE